MQKLFLLLAAAVAAGAQPNSIRSLYDAFGLGKQGTTLGWGYSVLVRYNGRTILFDAGGNADTFAANVKALRVDLGTVDFAALSHRHLDHASGFDHVVREHPRMKLYLPADGNLGAGGGLALPRISPELRAALTPEQLYYRGEERPDSGAPGARYWGANSEFVAAHKEVAPGARLIATRSPLLGDFSRYPPNDAQPALTGMPELSLALLTSRGVVLINGCSHSRVETIVAEAKKALGKPIHLLAGGFHWLPYDTTEIARLARLLKDDLGVERIAPAHCTSVAGFKILRDLYQKDFLYAGLESEIEFPR